MASDEERPHVPLRDLVGELTAAPLPEGTRAESIFMMIKLDDGSWCARSIGDSYNSSEFLGELIGYTHAATLSAANEWLDDPEWES
ncbi:hypothetical protein [Curtobacterium sp. ER1/6]|uniref:hypothetical protein n=1 Tax=Curtobacterium sp. ER1/6 TaxID=1891920 RepID=UPI00084FB06F|nr:hypothetical protein [Curtobacterium sp. ER1/6]